VLWMQRTKRRPREAGDMTRTTRTMIVLRKRRVPLPRPQSRAGRRRVDGEFTSPCKGSFCYSCFQNSWPQHRLTCENCRRSRRAMDLVVSVAKKKNGGVRVLVIPELSQYGGRWWSLLHHSSILGKTSEWRGRVWRRANIHYSDCATVSEAEEHGFCLDTCQTRGRGQVDVPRWMRRIM
jgi:hypothetical protein